MKSIRSTAGLLASVVLFLMSTAGSQPAYAQTDSTGNGPPVYIAFQWHMHQPVYYPGKSVVETDAGGYFDYSVQKIHTDRTGPYTNWPADAVQKGIDANLDHLGAQVSFSGSLMQNLDNLQQNTIHFNDWEEPWRSIIPKTTAEGNPRVDMVGFGYHHPLMPLIPNEHIRKQISMHKEAYKEHFPGDYSKGIFPPENAFHPRIIPALKDQGLEWVMVDNIHFERASRGYPYNTGGAIYEPNKADIRNPDPGDWTELTGLYSPLKVSAQWAHQPHYVSYTNPKTGEESRMIAVPTSHYPGNEDGRGGFGALQYEEVLSQLEEYNTDPEHPILVVLHHDGDNHGGGSSAYYNNNFQNFVDWVKSHLDRFVATTVQDYLDRFPPDTNDVIYSEPGSWIGADGGDPEFKKWNGDPDPETGYSPDRNSWGVVTATRNWVETAGQIAPDDSRSRAAWSYMLNAEASDYWYWDGSLGGIWDTNPTRASNMAYETAHEVVTGSDDQDQTGPAIYFPQRQPYNPGGLEWDQKQPGDFTVWSYIYDLSGLQSVVLKVRKNLDGEIAVGSSAEKTYSGGAGVGQWQEIPMDSTFVEPRTNISPMVKAFRYEARVEGYSEQMLDYYIEAVDSLGNISRSPIEHVWVGSGSTSGGDDPGDAANFTMDGLLDSGVPVAADNSGSSLYAAFKGDTLYFAGESAAQRGGDVFLMLSGDRPGDTVAAPWAKAEAVAEWDLYLANEADNNWAGWFNHSEEQLGYSYVDLAAGDILEGAIDLSSHYEQVPDTVYVSMLTYGTQDGDSLVHQVPAGNADNVVVSEEWLALEREEVQTTISDTPQPGAFSLNGNYPNPFNPRTKIHYSLPEPAKVTLEVYTILGQRVEVLVDRRQPAGTYRIPFDGANLSSGSYIYRLKAGAFQDAGQMLLVK